MKVEEVRIGNWVKMGGLPEQVNNITTIDVNGYSINRYEPIPLTEDILLKCGFLKNTMFGYNEHFIYRKGNIEITALYNCDFAIVIHETSRVFHYVHQLQNLYFSITNNDLKIEL